MIEVQDIRKDYGSLQALRGVSFSIAKGEIVGLLGPNGAGKTTMMKILTGYLVPTDGVAKVGGIDVTEDRETVQAKIGYLPENAPLYLEMSVQDYLLYIGRLRGVEADELENAVIAAIKRTGLADRSIQLIGTLSKGYRQRVGIAQAILHKPELLILDEPTNGLDPTQIREIRNLIKELARESTVIVSSHILREIELTCERALIIHRGELRLDQKVGDLGDGVTVTVDLDDAVNPEADFKALEGVIQVAKSGGSEASTRWTLTAAEDATVPLNRRVYDLASSKGWGLNEVTRVRRDLESVFQEVVAS